jgi:carboxylesterase type B
MFWLYGGGFVMGDATEENYLPGPLLDTKQVTAVTETTYLALYSIQSR